MRPRQTVDRLRRLLPLLGITRVANVTGLDSIGIPVVMVCRPNSRALSVSQGKGLDLWAAKASGLMESVESFHAERIQRPLKLASYNELRLSHSVIEVEQLARPTHSRYDPELRLLWIEGSELLSGEDRWLPFETVHTDLRLPRPSGGGAFFVSSNGLAAGNHILEALSHALCELIERDASSLLQASGRDRRRQRRLDLATVDDALCRRLLECYEYADIAVAVWETTTDIGLPAFDCLIVDREPSLLRPLAAAFGAGCHPSRAVALARALTEAAQSRLTTISGSRDDLDRPTHERVQQRDTSSRLHALITEQGAERSFLEAPTFETITFEEDVALELDHLEAVGIDEVVAVELTRDELEIPVVKVVVPGLEAPHRVPGYRPGPRSLALMSASSSILEGLV